MSVPCHNKENPRALALSQVFGLLCGGGRGPPPKGEELPLGGSEPGRKWAVPAAQPRSVDRRRAGELEPISCRAGRDFLRGRWSERSATALSPWSRLSWRRRRRRRGVSVRRRAGT